MSWSDVGQWRPVPFRQFILKVHSRCDLACTYCYVYQHADQGWRTQPRSMSGDVVARAAARMAQHVQAHDLAGIDVILHGGEPLLVGAQGLTHCVATVREAIRPETAVTFAMQTNGMLLDEAMLSVLDSPDPRRRVLVSVSLDGPAAVNDRRRVRADGTGSHATVARALRLLGRPEHRHLFGGVICVADPESDPVETFEGLLEFAPPQVDFLLPHANWANPPRLSPSARPIGAWLTTLFDHWYDAPRRQTRVRLFEELIHLILGGRSRTEQIGLSPAAMVVVNTDGSLEQVDTLRSAYAGAAETGMTVFANTFDEALAHPDVRSRQMGLAGLCRTCRDCPITSVCGGGHYAHRYHPQNGFENPSVYCADLAHLIMHVARRIQHDLERTQAEVPVA